MWVTAWRELSSFLCFLTSVGSFDATIHQGYRKSMRGTLCPFPIQNHHGREVRRSDYSGGGKSQHPAVSRAVRQIIRDQCPWPSALFVKWRQVERSRLRWVISGDVMGKQGNNALKSRKQLYSAERGHHSRISISGIRWDDRNKRARGTCVGVVFEKNSKK